MIYGNPTCWGPLASMSPGESTLLLMSPKPFGSGIRALFDPLWGLERDRPELFAHLTEHFPEEQDRRRAAAWVIANPELSWPTCRSDLSRGNHP